MPKFPIYEGELPACLSPLNPRHYWLLIYWVFFRPTALKCYLYQADEELYKNDKGIKDLLKTFHIPAYRNLFLIVFCILNLLTIIRLVFFYYFKSSISISLDFFVFFLEFLSIITGYMASMVILFIIIFAITRKLMFCLVFCLTFFLTINITIHIVNIALETLYIIIFGIFEYQFISYPPLNPYYTEITNIIYFIELGIIISIIFSLIKDISFGIIFTSVFGMLITTTIGTFFYISEDIPQHISFVRIIIEIMIIAILFGNLRLIFYPIQLFLSLLSHFKIIKHPLYWSEFIVLPLRKPSLEKTLNTNIQQGLFQLATIMSNPFQRWQMQQIFYTYSHNQSQHLHFIYNIVLNNSKLNYYVFVPIFPKQWQTIPNYNQLLLGELASKYVDSCNYWNSEKIVWHLTKRFRNNQPTPLTKFAGLLYELTKIEREDPVTILNQPWAKEAYTNVNQYQNGEEISQSFASFTTYINYQTIKDLANANQINLPDHQIRPNVLIALTKLQETGNEITTYQTSTSRARKLEALSRANDNLEQLKTYVATEITEPERYILEAIIDQWQPIITTASGEIARFQITEPITDPYIAGNPVTGNLFVGREDILRQFTSLWKPEKCPSIVLYGHRRMGKTSILQNLTSDQQSYLIDANMQRIGFVKNTGELLYNIAINIYDTIQPDSPEPNLQQFDNPYTAFDRFLKKLDRKNKRLLILIDEFEIIETKINQGIIEAKILEYLRSLITTYNWFIITLAGLHTLEEMRYDYWHPFFQGIESIHVGFLSKNFAHQLITEPDPDFPLEYTAEAINKIIQITYNQPYLIQRICKTMIRNFNEKMFNNATKPSQTLTITDVQTVIESKDFFQDANAYFNGIWTQANVDEIQPQILKILAPTKGLTFQELQLPEQDLEPAIKILEQHDVIRQQDGKYIYNVELMQRWILQFKINAIK